MCLCHFPVSRLREQASETIDICITRINSFRERESIETVSGVYFSMTMAWWRQGNSWALGITASRGLYVDGTLAIFYFGFFMYLGLLFLCRMASYVHKIWLLTALKFYIIKLCHRRKTKDFDLTFLLPKSLDPKKCLSLGQLCLPSAHPSVASIVMRCVCVGREQVVLVARQNSAYCMPSILVYQNTFWGRRLPDTFNSRLYILMERKWKWRQVPQIVK